MVFTEGWNIAYNSIATVADITRKVGTDVLKGVGVIQNGKPEVKLPPDLQNLKVSKLVYSGGPIVRIAAISGAMAVVLGAYGAHTLPLKEDYKEREEVYHVANKYHFIHTLSLLGVPLCRYPKTAATFMTFGMIFFCGTCYYQAFTGNKQLSKLTPVGGMCFIVGWLSMLF